MVSMQDVAKKAGVSNATVSRVLNGCTSVSEATRKAVFAVCEELNYKINPRIQDFVRKSRSGFTRNIAVVFVNRDFSDPAYNQILDELAQALSDQNFQMSLVKLTGSVAAIYDLPPILRDERVDGILLTGDLTTTLCETMAKLSTPTVVLGNYSDEILCSLSNIAHDYTTLLRDVTNTAIKQGAKRFAFVSENPQSHANQLMLVYFRKILKEYNLELGEDAIFWSETRAGISAELQQVFTRTEFPFDVLLVQDSRLAFELSHLATARRTWTDDVSFQFMTRLAWKGYKLSVPVISIERSHEWEIAEALKLIEHQQNGHRAVFRVTV